MYVNNFMLKQNWQLRKMAREQLKGNWGMAILVCFLFSLLSGIGGAIPAVGFIICLVVAGPFTLGLNRYFIKLIRGEGPIIEDLFDGFRNFSKSFILYILMSVFVLLWSLLLIIPGIIAGLSYSQAFFILNDNPEMTSMDALKLSKEMMKGQKGKLFLLELSFIGWAILCIFTLGIGYLWLVPYMQTSTANFYEDLKIASVTE